ncbi:hypothetical protein OH76DRAFT_227854 [Lentinus brumalis]|uniref:Uncharacterized protein n=1 Tax=Lentinus brumalis TaxID=2498619 RepID=A0A371DH78_9APHY|nr:hypothetical protein OH76DRAFT_227854 [Polyporus brumalis]
MGAAFFGPGRGRTPGKTFSSPTEYIRATHRQGSHWSTLESHKLHLSRSKLELERLPCRRLGMFAETSAPAALRPIQASAMFLVKGQNVLDRLQCPPNAVQVLSHCQTQGPPHRILPAGTTSARQTMHGLPHGRRRQVSPPDAGNLFQSGRCASCALPGRAQSLYCILTTVVSTGHTAQREDRVHLFSEDGCLIPLGKLWAIQQADAQGLCFPVDISLNSPLVRSSRCCPGGR